MFGFGFELYVVGFYEFYFVYVLMNYKFCLFDIGYYYLIEMVLNKILLMLFYIDKFVLYVFWFVCWDSDYVVVLDDELREIVFEIVCN